MITTTRGDMDEALLEKRRRQWRESASKKYKRNVLSQSELEKRRTAARAYYSTHAKEVGARSKAWRIANPEKDKANKKASYEASKAHPENRIRRLDRHLLKRYGISVADRNAIISSQNSKCAICLTDAPGCRGWHVDHNHQTGVVRGILCWRCNVALAGFRDDPNVLRKAAKYLDDSI